MDSKLFACSKSELHCLHLMLPVRCCSSQMTLHPRGHSYDVPRMVYDLTNCSFILQSLYKKKTVLCTFLWLTVIVCLLEFLDLLFLVNILYDHCIMTVTIKTFLSYLTLDAAYCYRRSSVVCQSVCRNQEPCKNGWIAGWDAIRDVDLGGPNEARIRWGPDAPCKRPILRAERLVSWSLTSLFSTNTAISETKGGRKVRPIVKYRDSMPVQKLLNQLRCRLGCELSCVQGSMY